MYKRDIKSYVLRAGRTSKRQQHAIDNLLDKYEIKLDTANALGVPVTPCKPREAGAFGELVNAREPLNFKHIFNNNNEVVVEIGFGMGHSLYKMAKSNPNVNYIGIEVHIAGVGGLAALIDENNIQNVRIINGDAVEIFKNFIANGSLSAIQIFFPDPWPKKRHHKRRLINKEFVNLLVSKLKPGGTIHTATDWEDYAEQMLEVLSSTKGIVNMAEDGKFIPKPASRPYTKFENRGKNLGHGVWDLLYKKLTKKSG